jgi:hypothetical protein
MNVLLTRSRWLWLCLVLLLAACQAGDTPGAAAAIEAYLEARVQSHVDQMSLLSCPDWEGQARVEATSFQSMNAKLDGVTCTERGEEGGYMLVDCQGQIVTTYQGEVREWSMAERPFRALLDGGEWLMCGYGE